MVSKKIKKEIKEELKQSAKQQDDLPIYDIKAIRGARKNHGVLEVLVSWEGYPESDN